MTRAWLYCSCLCVRHAVWRSFAGGGSTVGRPVTGVRLAVVAVVIVMGSSRAGVAEQFHREPKKQVLGGQVDAPAAVKLQRRSATSSCIVSMRSPLVFPRPRCCSQYLGM